MSLLLDSYLKIELLKHIRIREGKKSSMEPNIDLKNKLKNKQIFGSRSQWGKDELFSPW